MTEAFSVDPEALSDALDRMDGFQRTASALLAEIDAVVKNLHVSWDGSGAAAHSRAHQQWIHGAAQMDQALRRLHQIGTGAHGGPQRGLGDAPVRRPRRAGRPDVAHDQHVAGLDPLHLGGVLVFCLPWTVFIFIFIFILFYF